MHTVWVDILLPIGSIAGLIALVGFFYGVVTHTDDGDLPSLPKRRR